MISLCCHFNWDAVGIGRTGSGGGVDNLLVQEGMSSKSFTSAIMHKKYNLCMILISERR